MGIVFRQSVKTTIVTFTGALLGALAIYVSTKYIPKQQLGFFRNTLPEQALLLAQILLLGLHNTVSVYIHKYPAEDPRRSALLGTSFLVPGITVLILLPLYLVFRSGIIGFFQPEDQPLVSRFYAWLPVFTLLFIYLILLEQYMVSQMKVAMGIFMREILVRLLLIALIFCFAWNMVNYDQLVIGSVLVYALPILILLPLSIKTNGFRLSLNFKSFSKEDKKDVTDFTWYHFLLSLSISLMAKIDIILLGMWASLSAAAVYGIAVYIISFLQIPYRAMLNASFPVLTQAWQANDMEKVRDVFKRSSVNIFIATVALAAIIACNLHNAIAVLPKGFEAVAPLVLILLVGRLTDMATGMNDQVLSISNYYRFTFIISILIVFLIIGFNYFLIPRWGYYGAAWATSVAVVIFNISKVIFLQVRLGISTFSRNTLLVLASGVIASAVGYYIPHIKNPISDGFIRSILICLVYGISLYFFKASPDFNNYLLSVKRNKRLF
jgi:O-antigen/teichoic acid export membrane protein